IMIVYDMIVSLKNIHKSNYIHGDLHSDNIFLSMRSNEWLIGDLEHCGPANKASTTIYGRMSYVTPELFVGGSKTKKSDIYGFGILMWEIYYEESPFKNYSNLDELAHFVFFEGRPEIDESMPIWYSELLKKCWGTNPAKRPDAEEIFNEIENQLQILYQSGETESDFFKFDRKKKYTKSTTINTIGCQKAANDICNKSTYINTTNVLKHLFTSDSM
ncbi:13767_t:CDS:1, partial [Racocetra persica]